MDVGGDLGVLLDLPCGSPPGSRRVWKLMYDRPARMFANWAARVVLLPSPRSHLLKTVPPMPLANGVTTTSVGLVSLNGIPRKPSELPVAARASSIFSR